MAAWDDVWRLPCVHGGRLAFVEFVGEDTFSFEENGEISLLNSATLVETLNNLHERKRDEHGLEGGSVG